MDSGYWHAAGLQQVTVLKETGNRAKSKLVIQDHKCITCYFIQMAITTISYGIWNFSTAAKETHSRVSG